MWAGGMAPSLELRWLSLVARVPALGAVHRRPAPLDMADRNRRPGRGIACGIAPAHVLPLSLAGAGSATEGGGRAESLASGGGGAKDAYAWAARSIRPSVGAAEGPTPGKRASSVQRGERCLHATMPREASGHMPATCSTIGCRGRGSRCATLVLVRHNLGVCLSSSKSRRSSVTSNPASSVGRSPAVALSAS